MMYDAAERAGELVGSAARRWSRMPRGRRVLDVCIIIGLLISIVAVWSGVRA